MALHYNSGTYGVQITSQKLSETKSGKPQVVITFRPLAYENTTVPEESPERWMRLDPGLPERCLYMVLTEKTMEFVPDQLEKIGLVFDDWARVDEDHPQCVSIVDSRTRMYCKHEQYQGKDVERWGVPGDGPRIESIDQTKAAQVQAMFGRFAKGSKSAAKPAAAKDAVPTPPSPQAIQAAQAAPFPSSGGTTTATQERVPGEDDLEDTGGSDDFPF